MANKVFFSLSLSGVRLFIHRSANQSVGIVKHLPIYDAADSTTDDCPTGRNRSRRACVEPVPPQLNCMKNYAFIKIRAIIGEGWKNINKPNQKLFSLVSEMTRACDNDGKLLGRRVNDS